MEYILSESEAEKYSTADRSQPRTLVLAFEATAAAVDGGLLKAATEAAAAALGELAAEGGCAARVAVVCFDTAVHLHRAGGGALALPALHAMPTLPAAAAAAAAVDVATELAPLQQLLRSLPDAYAANGGGGSSGGAALPSAVHAALQLLADGGGRLLVFSASGASGGPGKTTRELPTPPTPAAPARTRRRRRRRRPRRSRSTRRHSSA